MNKTIKAIIIDDEPLAHKVILQYVEDLNDIEIVGQCYIATEAYKILNEVKVDLIFLDINMPKLKGLDFLRTLEKRPQVIVTSAYEEYALEGYELQVSDYLLKPFRFDRFVKAIRIARNKIFKDTKKGSPNIFLKVDKRHIQVNVSEIQYLESYGNYVKVWLESEFLLTPRTLSSFESELQDDFFRIHKSYIVKRSFISSIEGNIVTMKNGNQVTVGKNYKNLVKGMF